MIRRLRLSLIAGIVAATVIAAAPAAANHSWNDYHWARTSNPFTVKLGDNVSGAWDSYLATTSRDWTASSVLDTPIVAGNTSGRKCRPTSGRVEVCNAAYGNTGWLGVAQIWLSGGHIVQGTAKVNDTYFNTERYNTPAWRNFVMCQEVGHTFGLGHVNEEFGDPNTGSCMDYTNDPSGAAGTNGTLSNEHPNAHDYEMLESLYAHTDGSSTVASSTSGKQNGKASKSTFTIKEKGGLTRVVHVLWVAGHERDHLHASDID